MKTLLIVILIVITERTFALSYKEYLQKPKLTVVLVIDQFRADFLRKFQKSFLPTKSEKGIGGFNFLMENGAFFPNAEYSVMQSMTCPGHAMIMTGSFPHDMGIVLNDWFDKKSNSKIYCAFDEVDKLSPRRLKSTTVGDELKSVSKNSKVFAIALKDRSSIMLGGHRADAAYWIDNEEMKWTSSSYYTKSLPTYIDDENKKLVTQYKISKENGKEAKKDFATYLGVKVTTDLAISTLKNEKLGMGSETDILAISYSTHDMTGHTMGPDSLEVKAITHVEDAEIGRLLTSIKNQLGSLEDVVFVLTADHGIAPNVDTSLSYKIDSGKIDYEEIYSLVNKELNKKFSSTSKNWIQGHKSFNLYLDDTILEDKKLDKEEVENAIRSVLLKVKGVSDVVTSSNVLRGIFPIGEKGEQVKRQYLSPFSGDLIIIPQPFYMEKDDNCVTHMTGYSYDRTVPLIIVGKNIKSGIYSGANIIDLAPTLTHLLQVLPPTTSSGKVLSQIFK